MSCNVQTGDRKLASLAERIDFLYQETPINATQVWNDSRKGEIPQRKYGSSSGLSLLIWPCLNRSYTKSRSINWQTRSGRTRFSKSEKVNFNIPVLHAIEKKVKYMKYYRRNFDNTEMCTL